MDAFAHWQHFLALEADFAATSRYVEFSSKNFKTYSIEYTKLILAAASEIDVLCKAVCNIIDITKNYGNIDSYRNCLTTHTKIVDEKVLIRRYSLSFEPW